MHLQAGTRLGPYEIVSLIGRGGMGEVYRARDTRLGRQVAIKVIAESPDPDASLRRRFQREGKIVSLLSHPCICTLYDLGSVGSLDFIVMELVEGQTLEGRIGGKPLPLASALSIFLRVASGLEAAHRSGVIHRDLKPANIKVSPEGEVKILDFGLAKFTSSRPLAEGDEVATTLTHTTAGTILGSAPYMSPEQARGRPLDSKTDVWSFGACLFEALVGERAFGGEDVAAVLARIIEGEPDWSRVPTSTPRKLLSLLRSCLMKQPEERPASMTDVLSLLKSIETGLAKRRQMRRQALPILGVVILLAAVVVGLSRTWREGSGRSDVSGLAEGAPASEAEIQSGRSDSPSESGPVAKETKQQDRRPEESTEDSATLPQRRPDSSGVASPAESPLEESQNPAVSRDANPEDQAGEASGEQMSSVQPARNQPPTGRESEATGDEYSPLASPIVSQKALSEEDELKDGAESHEGGTEITDQVSDGDAISLRPEAVPPVEEPQDEPLVCATGTVAMLDEARVAICVVPPQKLVETQAVIPSTVTIPEAHTIVIQTVIGVDGRMRDTEIVVDPYDLARFVVPYLSDWRYAPARLTAGAQVAVRFNLTVRMVPHE